jgi:hypothetical protein
MKASILFYLPTPPTSTTLRAIEYHPPAFPDSRASSPILPPSIPRRFGWLLCEDVNWRPPKATTNFAFFIFLPQIRWPKRLHGVLPYRHRPARRLSQVYSNNRAAFRLVVASSHPAGAIEIRGPIAPSIFILLLTHLIAETTSKHPPPRVPPVRIASPMPPPSPTPSFGWLLHLPVEQRPSKTGAPPIS